MTRTNKDAEQYLYDYADDELVNSYDDGEAIVHLLVEGGFIAPDPLSDAEQIIVYVKDWFAHNQAPDQIYEVASSWSITEWQMVIDWTKLTIYDCVNIVTALELLAKEAGIIPKVQRSRSSGSQSSKKLKKVGV